MVRRWFDNRLRRDLQRLVLVLTCLLAVTAAWADSRSFSLPLEMDDRPLGTLSGRLTIDPAPTGGLTWSLSDGAFRPASVEDARVLHDPVALEGSGTVDKAERLTIREFKITLEQNSGVDVSYRFRLMAEISGDSIRSVSIEPVR